MHQIHIFLFKLNSRLFLLANNPDVVDKLEDLIAQWSKVIEQVLAESEQVSGYYYICLSLKFKVNQDLS